MLESLKIFFNQRLKLSTLVVVLCFSSFVVKGQSPITAINTTSVTTGLTTSSYVASSPSNSSSPVLPSTSYTNQFGTRENLFVSSYTVGGNTYDNFVLPDTLIIQRTDAGRQLVIFYAFDYAGSGGVNGSTITVDAEQQENEEGLYRSGLLNAGYDNILVNDATNFANVERIDIIYYSGLLTSSPSTAVFPVIDRAGNDDFKIAAITSLDSNGDPSGYGTLVSVPESNFGNTGLYSETIVFRRQDLNSDPLPHNRSTGDYEGVATSFSDLGISANQIIYGYSLFGFDVNTASHTLTDISTFPTNTPSSSGLDLVAGVSTAVASDNNLIAAKGPGGYKAALSTWLKANVAASITTSTDGSTVTDWQDQWLGNHDATTGAAAPTYRSTSSAINFNPTVDFTASTTSLTIANNTDFNTASSYTNKGINLAFRTSTSDITTRQVLYEQGGNTRGIIVYIQSSNLYVSAYNRNNDGAGSPWNNGTNITTVSTSVSTDTEYILTLELAGTSGVGGTLTPYINGTSFGSLSSVGLLFSDTDGIEFGGSDGSTQYDDGTNPYINSFYGEISEFIYCNEPGSFPTTQRDRIESYLALKYGITLDQSVPNNYVNSDGTTIFNTTNNASLGGFLEYNNDIAGIGRDDASEFEQQKSRSENIYSDVTIDKGAAIGVDNTWLIWGNDGGDSTVTELFTKPDSIVSRIEKVWRVAEEKSMGQVSVSFDLTELGLTGKAANELSLLVAGSSSAADFSSATIVSGGVINGTTITFSGVDFSDGQYFTLGTEFEICAPGGIVTGLTLWLKADSGTKNSNVAVTSGAVDEWTNAIFNANFSEVAVTDGGEPILNATGMNFNPYVSFDGVDDFMEKENFLGSVLFSSQNNTIFYAFKRFDRPAPPDVLAGFQNSAGSAGRVGYFESSSLGRLRTDFYGDNVSGTLDIQDQYVIGRSYSDASNINVHINGYKDGEKVNLSSLNTALEGDYAIGAGPNGGNDTESHAGEMIIFNTALSATDANKVESYLGLKYGITLSNDTDADATLGELLSGSATITEGDYVASDGTTIFWNYGNHGTFINDVAGIGRDDASCLEQKQSISENTDDVVTMGLGEIAVSNVANPNNIDTDLEFLVWANDNNSTAKADEVAYTEETVTHRMERIWKVQETGTVAPTDIAFDLTGLGYTGSLSDYQLIVSNAAGLTSPTIYQAASFTSNVVTFNDIDLTDGQFFTLATQRTACGPGGVSTNLQLWLRADAGTNDPTNGVDVTSWSDQSGQGNNADDDFNANIHPPSYVTNGTNFNPHIAFTVANTTFLTIPDAAGLNPTNQALFVAGTMGSATQAYASFVGKTEDFAWNEGWTMARENTNVIYHKNNSGDATTVAETTFPQGDPTLYLAYSNGTNDSININFRDLNGIATNTPTLQTTQPVIIGASMGGGNTDVTAHLDGNIGDIVMFNDDLTQTQRQQVATYMAIKYGITLDQTAATNYIWSDGTTVLWNGTTNSTYNNDIAGIGKDNASCFVQKQSKSVNAGEILTIGLGAVASTNLTNVNSFDDNGDYLIWGNDAGTTAQATANTADVPSTISERMSRVWKVQDTGLVGNTELEFDLTGLGYSVDATDFSLIISNSSTMASGTLTTGGTFAGSALSFSGINLTDGQYFTLATANTTCGPGGVNTGIGLWLRADVEVFTDAGTTLATNGQAIDQWNDQSSPRYNGNETNAGGGAVVEPVFQTNEFNFNPSIFISDQNTTNNSYIETATNNISGNMTLIALFETGQNSGADNDIDNTPTLIGASNSAVTDGYGLGVYNGEVVFNAANNDDFTVRSTTTYNNNIPYIATATRVQAASGAVKLYVNSKDVATGTSDNVALDQGSSWAIGNQTGYLNNAQFQGKVGEVLVFDRVITEAERAKVESYLSIKYGLTRDVALLATAQQDYIAGDGDIVWDYDNQGTTYHNDIFGIARDDLSCFEQQKSKSINSDAIVTFDNGGSFSQNDSWLISGNDNAAIEATKNTERPATINSRLNREWRVQETGTVGSIELTYDLSTVTGTPFGANNLNLVRLMVDDDGDFSNGGTTLISPSSIDSNAKTATFDVDFTNGQYYTLGSIEYNALPITLISFEVNNYKESQVKLDWVTASEINNAFYTIEHSTDGLNFETVSIIDGAGNSNDLLYYTYIDTSPMKGTSFYRLKQTDFSGEFDYSEIRSVKIESQFKASYKAYPNPINKGDKLRISYTVERDQTLYLTILNPRGQVILREEKYARLREEFIEISTNQMDKGLNLIRILDQNNKVVTLKVLVR